ncbi:MAG: hypothetical protein ACKPEY_20075, partial [Planctomycetota bacterium]
ILLYDAAWIAGVDYDEAEFADDLDADYQPPNEEEEAEDEEMEEADEAEMESLDEMTQHEIEEETVNLENLEDAESMEEDQESNPSINGEEAEENSNDEETSEEEDDDEEEEEVPLPAPNVEAQDDGEWNYVTRSGRSSKTPARYAMAQVNKKEYLYEKSDALIMAVIISSQC